MNVLSVPEILLPNESVDKTKWSVIACDQFTGDEKYWQKLEKFCGDVSTLKMIFPEIYLGKDEEKRIENINATMNAYLNGGVFDTVKGFILTVRKTAYGRKRVGLIAAIDLESYSFNEKLAIRPTEAIVPERLPIRIKIRRNAPIELPHALLLIDDESRSVIEPVYERRGELKKLYSFDLNMNGGSLEGYLIEDVAPVISAIERLTDGKNLAEKYGDDKPFSFAVGDGNHSIATAKACFEELKKTMPIDMALAHPSRYCLVEINNIYDDDLVFEPIHRVVFGAGEDLLSALRASLSGSDEVKVFFQGKFHKILVPSNSALAIKNIQEIIDGFIAKNPSCSQDYIHGDENAIASANDNGALAVLMPKLKKEDLFRYVAKNGVLTRKSFSMGEAEEKRYYYESRKIK